MPPPGDTISDYLESLGWTQKDLALRTDLTPKTVSEICNGKAPISPRTALAFEKVFERPAHFWLGLQRLHDEYEIRKVEATRFESWKEWAKKFPLKQMMKSGYFTHLGEVEDSWETLLRFFAVSSPKGWESVWKSTNAAFRQTSKCSISHEAVTAWVRATEVFAAHLESAVTLSEFDARQFRLLIPEMRRQTAKNFVTAVENVQELCARVGILFVVVPELGKTGISGCTRWLSDTKVVVALTFRHKRDDIFWFTFFHELGHVLLHRKIYRFVLDNAAESLNDSVVDIPMEAFEEEANRFAADTLIDPTALSNYLNAGIINDETLLAFAEEQGIGPGIVVGRLQHLGRLSRNVGNDFKQKIAWSFE